MENLRSICFKQLWIFRLYAWFISPSTTIYVSKSGRNDQPVQIWMGEILDDDHRHGNKNAELFWSVTLTIEGARHLAKAINEEVDRAEAWGDS